MANEFYPRHQEKPSRPKKEGRDLFSLPPEEEKRIKEKVKEDKGVGEIFIHPFFGLYNVADHENGKKLSVIDICQFCLGNKSLTLPQRKLLEETMIKRVNPESRVQKLRYQQEGGFTQLFRDYIKELIGILTSGRPLLFLGDAKGRLEETVETMRQLGHSGEIVWYETDYALSSPGPDTGKHYSDVAEKMAALDIKKLIVGGQSNIFEGPFRFDEDYHRGQRIKTYTMKTNDENSFRLPRPTMCVGEFVWKMAETNKFSAVSISRAAFPFSIPRQQPITF